MNFTGKVSVDEAELISVVGLPSIGVFCKRFFPLTKATSSFQSTFPVPHREFPRFVYGVAFSKNVPLVSPRSVYLKIRCLPS